MPPDNEELAKLPWIGISWNHLYSKLYYLGRENSLSTRLPKYHPLLYLYLVSKCRHLSNYYFVVSNYKMLGRL